MTDILKWPRNLLVPKECRPNIVPFTRTGGRSLGGVSPSVRTDLGFWSIELNGILLASRAKMKTYEAIKDILSGSAGTIAVPIYAPDRAPYVGGIYQEPVLVTHDDGTTFSDGTSYQQGRISIVTEGVTPIGATTISVRIIAADDDLSGVFFSYQHALYRTGRELGRDGDVVTLKISPSIRQTIPDGADLNFDEPDCLCNLAADRGMDNGSNIDRYDLVSLTFNEDTNYWNQLALGLI